MLNFFTKNLAITHAYMWNVAYHELQLRFNFIYL